MSTEKPATRGETERRRYRVFVTRNSEYHCRDDVCVAVRDVASGDFVNDHPAIGRRMAGGIRFHADGRVRSFSRRGEEPHPGETLFFSDGRRDLALRTSELRATMRPPKQAVRHYRGA